MFTSNALTSPNDFQDAIAIRYTLYVRLALIVNASKEATYGEYR